MEGIKVLLVDDEQELVETLAMRLETRGFQSEATFSGEDALTLLGERPFDVVILDVVMPGKDAGRDLKHRSGTKEGAVEAVAHAELNRSGGLAARGAHIRPVVGPVCLRSRRTDERELEIPVAIVADTVLQNSPLVTEDGRGLGQNGLRDKREEGQSRGTNGSDT